MPIKKQSEEILVSDITGKNYLSVVKIRLPGINYLVMLASLGVRLLFIFIFLQINSCSSSSARINHYSSGQINLCSFHWLCFPEMAATSSTRPAHHLDDQLLLTASDLMNNPSISTRRHTHAQSVKHFRTSCRLRSIPHPHPACPPFYLFGLNFNC